MLYISIHNTRIYKFTKKYFYRTLIIKKILSRHTSLKKTMLTENGITNS